MDEKILKFDDTEIEDYEFHHYKAIFDKRYKGKDKENDKETVKKLDLYVYSL